MSTIGAVIVVILLVIVGVGAYFVGSTTATSGTKTTTVVSTSTLASGQVVTTTMTTTVVSSQAAAPHKTLKIAGIFSVPSTAGWASQNSASFVQAAKFFNASGYSVHVALVFDVAPASSAAVFQQYASSGYSIIFASDVSFESIVVPTIAQQYPNVVFYGANWFPPFMNNTANLDEMPYQTFYAEGIIAGSMTKSNIVGFETAFAFPTTLSTYNAFLLGARSVNPSVKGAFVLTNSWVDPVAAAAGLSALQSAGADVVVDHGVDPFAPIAAQKDVMTFGFTVNQTVNQYVLTNNMENSTLAQIDVISHYLNGNFGGQNYPVDAVNGGFYLSPCSSLVPAAVCQKAITAVQNMKAGILNVPFIGTMPSGSVNATTTSTGTS